VGMKYKPRNSLRAQQLRREAPPAERMLWRHLSARKLGGYKFSRQIQIGPFYGDLVCRTMKLVIELDGFSHEFSSVTDEARTKYMVREGYRVMRFQNSEIFSNVDGVLTAILEELKTMPSPNPSRLREGDS
jgi:very-short-patch-repair endonuclease